MAYILSAHFVAQIGHHRQTQTHRYSKANARAVDNRVLSIHVLISEGHRHKGKVKEGEKLQVDVEHYRQRALNVAFDEFGLSQDCKFQGELAEVVLFVAHQVEE